MSTEQLKDGYDWAYAEFYKYSNILQACTHHSTLKHQAKHLAYAVGWKRFEWLWNFLIKTGSVGTMRPVLEAVLSKVQRKRSAPSFQNNTDGQDKLLSITIDRDG